jgi:hypothetical protein
MKAWVSKPELAGLANFKFAVWMTQEYDRKQRLQCCLEETLVKAEKSSKDAKENLAKS